jgi:hypothetical protein
MSEEKSFLQPAIPRFDGHYDHWSMLMENLLRSKGYWSLIETGYPEPVANVVLSEEQHKQLDDLMVKDLKVKNYLFQSIDRTILEQILEKRTSKQIWDSMKKKFEGSARVKRSTLQALRRDFEVLEMKVSETITEYFARVLSITNKMRSNGEQMKDTIIVEKILRTLIEKFNYVVVSIEESKDIDTLTIDELQSSLTVHEQKFSRSHGEEQAFKVTVGDRYGSRGRGRGDYRGKGRGRGRQALNKATVECYKCHQLGHFQYECPAWEKEANYAQLNEHEEMLLMSFVEMSQATQGDLWFLDSGCSNHMSGNKAAFCEIDESFRETVKLGNNTKMSVLGKGRVRLLLNRNNFVITEVFYVPELKNSLLSIGQLQERGFEILFKTGKCHIYHPQKGLVIQSEMTANRMFLLLANTQHTKEKITCFQTTTSDIAHLWHCRYGHLSHKGLKLLQAKNMIHGLPQLPASTVTCTACILGKQHRRPISRRSTWRATQRLQLIHADICGLISPISNSKKRYSLCFIDDFSRKAWIYFLSEKSAALNMFKCFKKHVENETGLSIKCLRTDRGGNLMDKSLMIFANNMVLRDS